MKITIPEFKKPTAAQVVKGVIKAAGLLFGAAVGVTIISGPAEIVAEKAAQSVGGKNDEG